jgi:geranylgeranyl diphosphate synthase type II
MRRGFPTLHREYGVGTAVNVGDGMFALALTPLLDNTRLLGVGKSLRILEIVARMARESVEGQAVELDWVRKGVVRLRDQDYSHMCYKKTCWYTFIAPVLIGAVVADASPAQAAQLRKYATMVGIAFQIQDDLLNLAADERLYGKEIGGDLWEGKRTLILIHALRSAEPADQERAAAILSTPRDDKTEADVQFLGDLIRRHGSLDYAAAVAARFALRAQDFFDTMTKVPASVHRNFLRYLAEHVVRRDK